MGFFIIVFTVHALVNFYIGLRGWQALEALPRARPWFAAAIILLFISYPVGRSLESIWFHPVPITLHWMGAFWMAGMLYLTLMIIIVDIARGINRLVPFLNLLHEGNLPRLKLITFGCISALSLIIIAGGHVNTLHPRVSEVRISLPKQAGEMDSLRIVAASDIHLGTIIGPRKTSKMVNKINNLEPDIILFAGDLVDEDLKPVIRQNLGESLVQLHAPLGVFASTGNHEYIGGGEPSIAYLESKGIDVIRDSAILINNSFYLVGREDFYVEWATGRKRKSMTELLAGVDTLKPIIVLDHQPANLQEAVEANVDIQISGHTHHGQLWPINFITGWMFEVSRGYLERDGSHFYVSTGFGTWGPPVRTGNRPEIVLMTVTFN